jgi:V8-like Glu-specific endopeptidase
MRFVSNSGNQFAISLSQLRMTKELSGALVATLLVLGSGISCSSLGSPGIVAREAPTTPAAAEYTQGRQPAQRGTFSLGGEEDFTVRIVTPVTACSGALIGEGLVLTAHHCVSVRDGGGRMLSADLDPKRITVEVGSGHFPWAELRVRAIVSPRCGYAGGAGDLAILVLSKQLRGVRTIQPALDREPAPGDEVSHIGFGRCALSDDGIYLKHRASGKVDVVTKTGFRANAPLCPGDSGGPVTLQASRLLIGVVSAGAMDGNEATPDRVEFSRLDQFRNLFANAARMAAGTPSSELPPLDCPISEKEPDPPASGSKPTRDDRRGTTKKWSP